MLPQGSQCATGRAEWGAARVGERPASDRVVLEGAGLAAGAEVRVGRRFHSRHAGVIGVQVGVIHLIHGGQPVRAPVQRTRGCEAWLCSCFRDLLWVFSPEPPKNLWFSCSSNPDAFFRSPSSPPSVCRSGRLLTSHLLPALQLALRWRSV